MSALPKDSADRKAIPMCTGVLDYFPDALAEVAKVSKAGNDKHNPGQPLHWSRYKSCDHADALLRHLAERGGIDPDTGLRYSAEMAWRALAILQEELEAAGAPTARGAILYPTTQEAMNIALTERCGRCGEPITSIHSYVMEANLERVHLECSAYAVTSGLTK